MQHTGETGRQTDKTGKIGRDTDRQAGRLMTETHIGILFYEPEIQYCAKVLGSKNKNKNYAKLLKEILFCRC